MNKEEFARRLAVAEGQADEKGAATGAQGETQTTQKAEEKPPEEKPIEQVQEKAGESAAAEGGEQSAPVDGGAGEENDPDVAEMGPRAVKRIKQLWRDKKVAEEAAMKAMLEAEKMRGQLEAMSQQAQPAKAETKPTERTWADLTLEELDDIQEKHPDYADKVRQARPIVIKRMTEEAARAAVREVEQRQVVREQVNVYRQKATEMFPDLANPVSPLRVLADEIYSKTGIPELGIQAKDLAADPRGMMIAAKEAFARLAMTGGAVQNQNKQQRTGPAQLESGRGGKAPVKTPQSADRQGLLKDYVNGKVPLRDVLRERFAGQKSS